MRAILSVTAAALAASVVLAGCSSSTSNKIQPGTTSGAATTRAATPTKSASPTKSSSGHPAEADVTISSCNVDPTTSFPDAKLVILNHSSKKSNYAITVEFVNSSGTRVDEGLAAATNVAPNEKVNETAQGLATVTGHITCKITSVTRLSAVG